MHLGELNLSIEISADQVIDFARQPATLLGVRGTVVERAIQEDFPADWREWHSLTAMPLVVKRGEHLFQRLSGPGMLLFPSPHSVLRRIRRSAGLCYGTLSTMCAGEQLCDCPG